MSPVARFFASKLSDGAREQVRFSFEQALRWQRTDLEQRKELSRGGRHRIWLGTKSMASKSGSAIAGQFGKRRGRRREAKATEDRIAAAFALGSNKLTESCFELPPEHGPDVESGDWTVALRDRIEATARAGNASDAWRYLVTGKWDREPAEGEIERWAEAVGEEVVRYWTADLELSSLVAQRNAQSDLDLRLAQVQATEEMATNLWWIALATVTLTVLGGGGTALLVLFLDHG